MEIQKSFGGVARRLLDEVREHMAPYREQASKLRAQAAELEARADEREHAAANAIVNELVEAEPTLRGSTVKLARDDSGAAVGAVFELAPAPETKPKGKGK